MIPIDEVPEPPAEIRRLIESARVSFRAGGEPPASTQTEGGESADSVDRLAASTTFHVAFDYRAKTRWSIDPAAADRARIGFTIRSLTWNVSHSVWFRDRPDTATFWTDRLVRHELDHVRISASPRIVSLFRKRLRAASNFSVPVRSGRRIDAAWVDAAVDRRVNGVFDEINQWIRIRYRELDRQTDQGRLPTPTAFRFDLPR